MNLTILVAHESDARASAIIDTLGGQVDSERLAPFASVIIRSGSLPDFHLWECDWRYPGALGDRRTVVSLLADVGALENLRIVAVATSVERDVAVELSEAHEELERGAKDALSGARTRIATARIGVVGRREARPHALFFSPLADHNLVVLPYDRFDDARAADSIAGDDTARFATHGAVDVGALCGLWAPMALAPIDRGVLGGNAPQLFGLRLVQSRVRSLHAPTLSLHELFGEVHDALPVPNRYVQETKLSEAQIDALAAALVADVDGFHFPRFEQEGYELDEATVLAVLQNVITAAVKEAPAAIASFVRGEVDTIIRLTLQEIVAPDGYVKVAQKGSNRQDQDASSDSVPSPFEQARRADEFGVIPAAVWTALVDRILATIGGDPSADDLRAAALGGPDRVPVGKRDLLDGLSQLPGRLPRFALGAENVTVFGSAQSKGRRDPERFTADLPSEDPKTDLDDKWDEFLSALQEADGRLAEAAAMTTPFDWSGNVLTMLVSQEADARVRRSVERLDADAAIKSALRAVVGVEPVIINWISSVDDFRAMMVAAPTDEHQVSDGPARRKKGPRAGLLMRIGDRILEERSRAEDVLSEMRERLAGIESGEFRYRVNPGVYALMALGLAGLLFEFLTNPLGERLLGVLPEDAGTGSIYAPILLGVLFAAALLTNVGMSRNRQVRNLAAFGAWVAATGTVVVFGLTWPPTMLTSIHALIGVLILLAGYQAAVAEDELRARVIRIAGVVYAIFIIIVLAVLHSRGQGPLALIEDPQTLLRVGTLIQWTSQALVVGGLLVLVVNRGRARVRLERELRDIEWLQSEVARAEEAIETLGLAYVQWHITAASLAQVIRQPYGPIVTAAAPPDAKRLDGIRRASFADLRLTTRGADLLRNELRQELVPPGWLKRQYELRVEEFLRLESERQRMTMSEVRENRPETDTVVASPDEIMGGSATRAARLRFAELGDRGAFDKVSSAPIADESLLGLLDPVLKEPDAQRIEGGPSDLATAFDFLKQAGPSLPGPAVPSDEVHEFEGRKDAVERSMEQLLWWPQFFPAAPIDQGTRVEETAIRWIGGGPAKGSTAVQLLAVRVDYSPLYEYGTLRFGLEDEQAAEQREIFDGSSDSGIIG